MANRARAPGNGWYGRVTRVLATCARIKIADVTIGQQMVAAFKAVLRE